jgi:hypothetical protein
MFGAFKRGRENISLFQKIKIVHFLPRPVPTRGALRDRHGRWKQDAMDVPAQLTNASGTDGKGVWSRSPDAGIKSCGTLRRMTVAIKPGTPGRARNKP